MIAEFPAPLLSGISPVGRMKMVRIVRFLVEIKVAPSDRKLPSVGRCSDPRFLISRTSNNQQKVAMCILFAPSVPIGIWLGVLHIEKLAI